ncbi:hypothetical protein Ae201684P_018247 [Aphanomyces euteiches]|nr:hypothetical protein Ae201684P_018247 [Aphanomyces euteiches]
MTGANSSKHVLLIDNYDSFTYNLYQYLCQLGATVTVIRNDVKSAKELLAEYHESKPFDRILISPGPGFPKDAGISCDIIRTFQGVVPVAGVCLGKACRCEVWHRWSCWRNRPWQAVRNGKRWQGLVQERAVTIQSHSVSFVGLPETLPDELEVTSTLAGKSMIMGVRHKKYAVEGVQFHPESILTPEGMTMMQNFLDM